MLEDDDRHFVCVLFQKRVKENPVPQQLSVLSQTLSVMGVSVLVLPPCIYKE